MGMGEPPVSAGFGDEVELSRRGSYAGLDATIAGAGAGGSQIAKSVVSAGERSQSRQPRSNNIPSGSQQTDVVLPAQVPKVNINDWTYSQRIPSTT